MIFSDGTDHHAARIEHHIDAASRLEGFAERGIWRVVCACGFTGPEREIQADAERDAHAHIDFVWRFEVRAINKEVAR
jgi:hypothetical protein